MNKSTNSDETLLVLQKSLKASLNPVQPDESFVRQLQERLEKSPTYRQQRRTAATLLTLAAGLIIGLAVFLIGRRFIQEGGEA